MPTKSKKIMTQSEKFVEAAQAVGADDDAEKFDMTLKQLASSPAPKSVEKRKTKKPTK